MSAKPTDDDSGSLHFDAVLHPHRSLGPTGFYIVMGSVAAISFAAGIAFALMGAWPVLGFFGLDVLAIYLAFRLSYRSGRLAETVQLREDELAIRRIQPNGRSRDWTFHPYWVRVRVNNGPHGDGEVVLSSHGRSVALGRFLTADERVDFAGALEAALQRLRASDA